MRSDVSSGSTGIRIKNCLKRKIALSIHRPPSHNLATNMSKHGPAVESTFVIIKPDAVVRDLAQEIEQAYVSKGFTVVEKKCTTLSRQQAVKFYEEHSHRPFFESLVSYMTSGPVVLMKLSAPDAILANRKFMGATDPAKADEGTLRAIYGESVERNSVHGSDSAESAKRELAMFFPHAC